MSVNIFGSSKKVSGGPGRKGQPGIGFKILDNEGNFNIDSKRLANVAQPVSDNDAVTKVYVNEAISEQESNIDSIRTRMKRNGARSAKVASLIKGISVNVDETKSEVDHLKSFCQRIDDNITDIKEEYVTQQYYMNSMVANSKILTDLESNYNQLYDELNNLKKKVDSSRELISGISDQNQSIENIISGLSSDTFLNAGEINNIKKVLQSYRDENIELGERVDEKLGVISEFETEKIDGLYQKLEDLVRIIRNLHPNYEFLFTPKG